MILLPSFEPAIFLRRVNRFIAEVQLANNDVTFAHLANTGRMGELLIPGRRVWLEPATNPARKTKWSLFLIEQDEIRVCLQAVYANHLFAHWLQQEALAPFSVPQQIQREVKVGEHRFDFAFECADGSWLIEVKSVNFVSRGLALFPDAPTKRGAAHVEALTDLHMQGRRTAVVLITMGQTVERLAFNRLGDPRLAEAMDRAQAAGVLIKAYEAGFSSEYATFRGERPIDWEEDGRWMSMH